MTSSHLRSALRSLPGIALVLGLVPAPHAYAQTSQSLASDRAYNWLVGQQKSTGLVDSFQDNSDICYTYDQAVAAVAFLVRGDAPRARSVLDALKTMQYADGSWNTAYYCSTKKVQETQKHVGPVLWVAMAVASYEKRTADTTTYRQMALKAVNWSLQFQQSDGGINGGLDYNGSVLTWCATEHNEDAYAALTYFGYTTDAGEVKSFLETVVWDAGQQRWWGGRNDSRDPMDVNSWGVQALGATTGGKNSLDYVMSHHRSTQSLRIGSKTYSFDGFDFNSDRNDIWFEGQGQMAVSFKIVGRTADADYFIGEIIRMQDADGGTGVRYSLKATNNGYWKMSSAKSVSASGWLILAVAGYNPFKP